MSFAIPSIQKKKMTKRPKSAFFLYVLALALIWIFQSNWHSAKMGHNIKGIGSLAGLIGYAFFSLSFLLSSRVKVLESWFGGLDKIYYFHRTVGILGFCFILAHTFTLSLKWLPFKIEKFLLFTLPFHGRLSVNLGSVAFWLLFVLLTATLFPLLPYNKWKTSHKFMSLVFLLASLHFLLSRHLFPPSSFAKILLCIPLAIGLFGIFYKQIFLPFFKKKPLYEVAKITPLNDTVIEVFFRPSSSPLSFFPGQYAFFSFRCQELSREEHPFTLCPKTSKEISILVKNRGDFTADLYQRLQVKSLASLEGPYGRFLFSEKEPSQIWIAGGIGIVPFLVWARLLSKKTKGTIDLFYCYKRKEDAIFIEEFRQIEKSVPSFRLFTHCSEASNRLTIQKLQREVKSLKNSKIFMCGPKRLTAEFLRQFSKLKISKKDIIFENFEF